MSKLTLGSLFDGSGGFPLGGMLFGIEPLWASEIEPFPIRVTTKRIPNMKHYGDISTLNGAELPPVDIITFGSPCTDMSVAGKRAGLDGSQSVLFYEAIRIVKEMRCKTNGKYPRYIVWENVPGAFSSNGGEDFKAVLEAVIGVAEPNASVPSPDKNKWPYADCYMGDGWSVAYRTLDAQYFGVPQRRRRIYLVADFAGECADKILFEPQGLSRNFAPSGCPWKRTAADAENGSGATGFDGYNGAASGDVEPTVGVNCGMSTGRNGVVVLNDQGGERMDVTEDTTSTLRAEAHHPPCVMQSSGFCTEHSAKSRSVGFEEERSPTLRAGVVPGVAIENHPNDSRVKISTDGKVQTLTSRLGTGGGNVPLVFDEPKPCAWNGEQVAPTLTANNAGGNQRMPDKDNFNCVLEAYGICSDKSNSMKSSNPHSGIYKADTSRTIDKSGINPSCNQGGIAVVALQGSMIGREEKNGPSGSGVDEDVSFTLNTVDRHAVAYAMTTGSFTQVEKEKSPTLMARDFKDPNAVCFGIGRDAFNQGRNAKFQPSIEEELQPTLVAKGPGAVQNGFIVRRLTPTECARLQGFPNDWCSDLGIPNPTMEDIRFWYGVFETHRKIIGNSEKPKSLKQVAKWLKDPYSDAAEYKMWGNGVALPCVCFVLSGIVLCTQEDA